MPSVIDACTQASITDIDQGLFIESASCLAMCVCVCMCLCACVCVHACACVRECMCVYVHASVGLCFAFVCVLGLSA